MLSNILYGLGLIVLTGVIHTITTKFVFDILYKKKKEAISLRKIAHIDSIILLIMLATIIEASLWAALFLHIGALTNFEESIYFSLVTYTTLGYGDITLSEDFRLLGAIEAANGVIIFGWSTALVVGALQKIFVK